MVEDIKKEYKDTMQEVMLELKISTNSFLEKFKDYKNTINENLEIPVVISLKGDIREFEIDLFGLGETIKARLLLEVPSLKNTRVVNQNVTITKGLTLLHGKNQFFNPESKDSEFVDYNYTLFVSKKTDSSINLDAVVDWFERKILSKECFLKIKGKKIINQNELRDMLNEIIFGKTS